MKLSRQEVLYLSPFFLCIVLLYALFLHKPFFWDKDIIDSIQAHWFLKHNFNLVLPDNLDPGHPPLVGFLLAISWFIFGKSLAISHFIMLPFSIGIVIQSFFLIRRFCSKYKYAILILLLIDTTILTQMIVISSDLILLFFFLLSVNSIFSKNRLLLTLGIAGLSIINNRGILTSVCLFLFQVVIHINNLNFKKIVSLSIPYIPGFMLALGYLIFHYISHGWIGYHENSPWAGCYQRVPLQGMIRNTFIIGWRFFDYGKIIFFFIILYFIFLIIRKKYKIIHELKPLIILLILLCITYLPIMIISKNLLGHRYIIPCSFILSFIIIITAFDFFKRKSILFTAILIFLISGSFLVYPDKIAQGWDVTLAHIPYHGLHKKMICYLDSKGISFSKTGTVTPNDTKMKYLYLNNDERKFAAKNLVTNEYILYSNIFNDFEDSEIDILNKQWTIDKKYEKWNIKLILYKNPLSEN